MLYGYIVAFLGSLATCASMAEMASMYPISGGQYHWVALMAPPKYAKFLSWLTGWLSTMGWQAAASSGSYLGGFMIQALIGINHPTYSFARWQCTLLMYAVIALCIFVNTVLIKVLPGLEGLILILHVVGFFAIMIPVVHLAPISSNEFVWTDFTNYSGYSSDGVSWLIGQAASAILFIGYDGACHMAEEVRVLICHVFIQCGAGTDRVAMSITGPERSYERTTSDVLHHLHQRRPGVLDLHLHSVLLR